MKLKIKIKLFNGQTLPTIIDNGEWIDLRANEAVKLKKGELFIIPLGVAMKLPEGFEAHVLPRSSTPKKFGIMCANSQGIIDNSYSGNGDEWKFPALAIKNTLINKGDRICQFRIELSQKATILQKLKWLFCNEIVFEQVTFLNSPDRGGIGSTGIC